MSMRSPASRRGSTNRSVTRSVSQAESLVTVAATSTVDAFERHVADLARRLEGDGLAAADRLRAQRSLRRWSDRETGMCHTHLTLDPEADARLSAALDAAIAAERAKPDTTGRSTSCAPTPSSRSSRRGPVPGDARRRSACSSTTPPSSVACMTARSVRPVTGSRSPPTRCAAWPATPS